MREHGVRGGKTRNETGGETGSVTGGKTRSKTGSETGSKTGRDEFMLGFRVPTTCGKKTSITTYSGEVSPPPANRTTTQCETGGETGSKTGGETGSKTGGETGSETGGETGFSVPTKMLQCKVPTTMRGMG